MRKINIVLLARDCDSTIIVYNNLKLYFEIEAIILEKTISKITQFKRRVKLLGLWTAVGQLVFMMTVFPFLKLFSQKRKKEIYEQYHLDISPLPKEKIIHVDKLSSSAAREVLQKLNPDLIIVNGTRIISKKTLESVKTPFINIHVGITPEFRGVHGGYWAMATGKKNLFGVTIHYVDTGVDTGEIIEQVFTLPVKKDNFYTYPYLQTAICLDALKKITLTFIEGKKPGTHQPVTIESEIRFHPTIFQWLGNLKRTLIFVFLFCAVELFSELLCNTICPVY